MNEKLKRIYEAMSDKTLSFGCIVEYKWYSLWIPTWLKKEVIIQYLDYKWDMCFQLYDGENWYPIVQEEYIKDKWEIIGHPVMYWNTVDWIEKKVWWKYQEIIIDGERYKLYNENSLLLHNKWKDKTKSIDKQSQECIDFVESLIPKE